MTAQEYIESKLNELKKPLGLQPPSADKLEEEIVRLILSKKFRKYSANEKLINHIKIAVHFKVSRNEPLHFMFFHGMYKLWRLDEAPEADWAELFAYMYYGKYLKTICEIYPPGAIFDIFEDDIVDKLNGYSRTEILAYNKSEQKVLNFLKTYLPKNLTMKITNVRDFFDTEEKFFAAIETEKSKIIAPPALTDKDRSTIRLNHKANLSESQMIENKIYHDAYFAVADNTGHYLNHPDVILTFTDPFDDDYLLLGSTKNSIMRFWIGVGALRSNKNGSPEMTILSGNQLKNLNYKFEPVNITGLSGKNFSKIRVLKDKK
jgi:hypothetical protein